MNDGQIQYYDLAPRYDVTVSRLGPKPKSRPRSAYAELTMRKQCPEHDQTKKQCRRLLQNCRCNVGKAMPIPGAGTWRLTYIGSGDRPWLVDNPGNLNWTRHYTDAEVFNGILGWCRGFGQ